jgi:hypothetical protein
MVLGGERNGEKILGRREDLAPREEGEHRILA